MIYKAAPSYYTYIHVTAKNPHGWESLHFFRDSLGSTTLKCRPNGVDGKANKKTPEPSSPQFLPSD